MKTFREYTEQPIVSFDFDDTIYLVDWDEEQKDLKRDEDGNLIGELNDKIAKKIKDYKVDGWKVYVVTSRYAIWREEVETLLEDNNLMGYIDGVYFTNGAWKANKLKKLGVKKHYDDYDQELRRLRYKGIEGVKVGNK